jgi:histidinol dehydrogenase
VSAPPEVAVVAWGDLGEAERRARLSRPSAARAREVAARVRRILASVRRGGDAALARWTERLDGARLERFEVGPEEAAAAEAALEPAAREALERAARALRDFHAAQHRPSVRVETWPGVVCERLERPIERVGLYVPAGGAPLPSTALMLAVPATLAGCIERIVATPPRPDGRADPAVVAAALRGGATRILKLGGAQAIAALAYGTATVPRVDKIFGPGSAWVAEAKRQVAAAPEGVAVDLPAGPSELFVVADASAEPSWLAADLLAQAEHAEDAHVLLATDDERLARAVARELAAQLATLPRRETAGRALAAASLIVTRTLAEAFGLAARYAPEHLLVAVAEPERWRDRIGPAGAVYLGARTAGSLGDYATGANHALPTGGAARAAGGLGLADFLRATTFQSADAHGLAALAPTVTRLARLEGLEAHARAVERRLGAASPAAAVAAGGSVA